jgi:hypothetical protein
MSLPLARSERHRIRSALPRTLLSGSVERAFPCRERTGFVPLARKVVGLDEEHVASETSSYPSASTALPRDLSRVDPAGQIPL